MAELSSFTVHKDCQSVTFYFYGAQRLSICPIFILENQQRNIFAHVLCPLWKPVYSDLVICYSLISQLRLNILGFSFFFCINSINLIVFLNPICPGLLGYMHICPYISRGWVGLGIQFFSEMLTVIYQIQRDS